MIIKYFKDLVTTLNTIKSNQDFVLQQTNEIDAKLNNLDAAFKNHLSQQKVTSEDDLGPTKIYFDQSQNGINEHLNNIANRLEFVREEVLFELRVKTGSFKDKGNQAEIEPKVINRTKLDAGIKRINVGCGHIQPEGYINVDAREVPGVDVISSASELPFEDNMLDEIYCSHLAEHFTELEFTRIVLPHWLRKLNSEGVLRITVPDAKSMMAAYMNDEMSFDDLRKVTYGAQDYEGDFHYTMFTVDSLKELLAKAGFSRVELVEDNRVNGLCREMELMAYKGQ